MKKTLITLIAGAALCCTVGSCSCGQPQPLRCEARPADTDTTVPSRAPHLSTPTLAACRA